MSVKRWAQYSDGKRSAWMAESEHGGYVEYSDYAKLERKLKVTEEASAIFEKNSAACAEEFEARLRLGNAGNLMAHELRTMLTLHPERRGGLYEKALRAWDEVTGRKEPSLGRRSSAE